MDAPLSKTAFADKNSYTFVGWSTLAMFAPCAVLSWHLIPGSAVITTGFGGFALMGGLLILCGVRYEIDERGVRSRTRFKQRELRWDQVRRVELIRGAGSLNFWGEKEGINVSGPASWGQDGGRLMMFVLSQCQKLGIEWEGDKVMEWRDLKKRPTR